MEPAGMHCPSGGARLDFGRDSNVNGELDETELDPDRTQYLCNGAAGPMGSAGQPGVQGATGPQGPVAIPGANGQNALIQTSSEDVGSEHCVNGGIRIEVGVDTDGNGALQAEEIDADNTRYVCDGDGSGPQGIPGLDGYTTLILLSAEPAGAACLGGGSKVQVGRDLNRNGGLDPNEVDPSQTQLLCNGAQGTNGTNGTDGKDGAQGAAGAQGIPGANGQTSLISLKADTTTCQSGGSMLQVGLDANNNGVLDANEINASMTRYLCNGATGATGATGSTGAQGPIGLTGANGKNTLVATTQVAAGATCLAGGVKLEVGLDANDNGTLDAGEINAALTRVVCHGANGADTAVNTSAAAPGAGCSTGGIKVEVGIDANHNGTLDAAEIVASATRYVCNGAQGVQGIQGLQGVQGMQGLQGPAGPKGDTGATGAKGDKGEPGATGATGPQGATGLTGAAGAQGPQGVAGALAVYGDGSAGALSVSFGQTIELASVASMSANRLNMQFTNINISGTLIVPSGTVLRATGDITLNSGGVVTVQPGTFDTGGGQAASGIGRGSAGNPASGIGVPMLTAASLLRIPSYGGGAGAHSTQIAWNGGSGGGGSVALIARGNIRILSGGTLLANGENGVNPSLSGQGITGSGGGAGGLISLVSKGSITIAGTVRARGGNGADGFDGNGGNKEGGGGGGGGGIVLLTSSTSPAVTGTIDVGGGAAGITSGTGSIVTPGWGGGGAGGDGGNGGTTAAAAAAGGTGFNVTTVAPEPENLLL